MRSAPFGQQSAEMGLWSFQGKFKLCEVMPVPSFNVINGGSHAGNRLACQVLSWSALLSMHRLHVPVQLPAGVHDTASRRQKLQGGSPDWLRGSCTTMSC